MEEIKNLLVNQIEGAGPECQGVMEGGKYEAEKEEEEGIVKLHSKLALPTELQMDGV